MGTAFSSYNRSGLLCDLERANLDLLVIGGGITGAGILLDARVRGLSCALIEMQDFAAGTSSRSTKLIHGGLRYLKQLEVGLVAEVGRERAIVYENGPHVTRPEWMLLPIYKGSKYGKLMTSIGIRLYDFLAGVKRRERRQMLTAEQALAKEPLLKQEGLIGAGFYVEYRTDDARLTLEVIKEAHRRGAIALNYVKAVSFIHESGKISCVHAKDILTGKEFDIFAKVIVNATGPFADKVREIDGSKRGKTLHLTKGVHIVVDKTRFPLQNPVYFDVTDGRMIFAIPRGGKAYIGTTDTNFYDDDVSACGNLAYPRVTKDDILYLIDAVNFMFPSTKLLPGDVESCFAGVRPLIHEEGKAPSEISRRDEIFDSPTGLITIAGGKLTGYRKMAEKVVDIVCERLSEDLINRTKKRASGYPKCRTDKVPISGGKFGGSGYFPLFVEALTREGVSLGLREEEANKLATRYGINIEMLYDYLRSRQDEMENSGLSPEVFTTLTYALECELTCTPSDFFIRRTGSLFFDIDWLQKWKGPVINYMAEKLSWPPEQTAIFMADLEQRIVDSTEAV